MHNQTKWAKGILTWGFVASGFGLVLMAAGFLLSEPLSNLGLDRMLIIASGIFVFVLGVVSLLQYAFVRKHPQSGEQMMIQERDERIHSIRALAGSRAYGVSSSIAVLLLLWASFEGTNRLPDLSGDLLWFSLAALVVLPGVVYIGWIIYGNSAK